MARSRGVARATAIALLAMALFAGAAEAKREKPPKYDDIDNKGKAKPAVTANFKEGFFYVNKKEKDAAPLTNCFACTGKINTFACYEDEAGNLAGFFYNNSLTSAQSFCAAEGTPTKVLTLDAKEEVVSLTSCKGPRPGLSSVTIETTTRTFSCGNDVSSWYGEKLGYSLYEKDGGKHSLRRLMAKKDDEKPVCKTFVSPQAKVPVCCGCNGGCTGGCTGGGCNGGSGCNGGGCNGGSGCNGGAKDNTKDEKKMTAKEMEMHMKGKGLGKNPSPCPDPVFEPLPLAALTATCDAKNFVSDLFNLCWDKNRTVITDLPGAFTLTYDGVLCPDNADALAAAVQLGTELTGAFPGVISDVIIDETAITCSAGDDTVSPPVNATGIVGITIVAADGVTADEVAVALSTAGIFPNQQNSLCDNQETTITCPTDPIVVEEADLFYTLLSAAKASGKATVDVLAKAKARAAQIQAGQRAQANQAEAKKVAQLARLQAQLIKARRAAATSRQQVARLQTVLQAKKTTVTKTTNNAAAKKTTTVKKTTTTKPVANNNAAAKKPVAQQKPAAQLKPAAQQQKRV